MTAHTDQITALLANLNTSPSADAPRAARSTSMRHRATMLATLFISAAAPGCTDIDFDAQITTGGGCCSGCREDECPGAEDEDEDGCAEGETDSASTGVERETSSTSAGTDDTTGTTTEIDECGCPEGYTVTPAEDACVRVSVVDPAKSPTIHDVCESEENDVYGSLGAIVEPMGTAPGGTNESNAYWNGRLNEVGVWACAANSEEVSESPVKEWIGFSVCIDIPESGDYILGTAGDTRVRFDIDGSPVFALDTSLDVNFKHWHLLPMHLSSGIHILEVRGRNDGGPAAFGAEISGPFVAGSLLTDAAVLDEFAYQKKLMWSTGQLAPSQTFQLGEASGWQCPKEAALDACAPEPVCVDRDHQACE